MPIQTPLGPPNLQSIGTPGSNIDNPTGVAITGSTESSSQSAIFGINKASGSVPGGLNYPAGGGVWGHTKVQQGSGVIGSVEPNVQAAGVTGIGPGTGQIAGQFYGNVEVTGQLTVGVDIVLPAADCAEEFDIGTTAEVEAGTVMVLDDAGALQPSSQPYDKKVAGVISGAGLYRPGLILDKGTYPPSSRRLPVALVGKVYCKVDAQYGRVKVGDLLTTSATRGHAMIATDCSLAFGAVIGKALKPLTEGCDLVPILVALQ